MTVSLAQAAVDCSGGDGFKCESCSTLALCSGGSVSSTFPCQSDQVSGLSAHVPRSRHSKPCSASQALTSNCCRCVRKALPARPHVFSPPKRGPSASAAPSPPTWRTLMTHRITCCVSPPHCKFLSVARQARSLTLPPASVLLFPLPPSPLLHAQR